MDFLSAIHRISFIGLILFFVLIPLTFPRVDTLNRSHPNTRCFKPFWFDEFCLCTLGHHYLEPHDSCVPTILIGGPCNKSEDCSYSGPKAICAEINSNRTCVCDEDHIYDESDKQCVLLELYRFRNDSTTFDHVDLKLCPENGTCPTGSKCVNSSEGAFCECQSHYHRNPESGPYCISPINYNESCSSSSECRLSDPYTICSIHRICQCAAGRFFNPNTGQCTPFPNLSLNATYRRTRNGNRRDGSSFAAILVPTFIIIVAAIGLGLFMAYRHGKFRNLPYMSQVNVETNSPVAAFRRQSASSVSYLIPSSGLGRIQSNMGQGAAGIETSPVHLHANSAYDNMKSPPFE